MTTVPAHGAPPPPGMFGGSPHSDFEYRETTSRDEYDAAVAAQQAATAAAPAPAERPAEPAGQHQADMEAEVAHEADEPDEEYPDGAIAVPLEGHDGRRGVVHILDALDWPSDANSALHVGDYESWADGALAGGDYDKVWLDLRPTMRQVQAMFAEFRRLTGQDEGKSLRSPASLRRAARRSR